MAHVSDSDAPVLGDCIISQEQLVLGGDAQNDNVALLHPEVMNDNTRAEEVNKKRLLEELESALVPPPQENLPMPPIAMPKPSLGLGFQVIDETALLESVPRKTTTPSKNARRRRPAGKEGGGPIKKQDHHHNTRRRAAGAIKKQNHHHKKTVPAVRNTEAKYSRKEMEALRFANVPRQQRFWKAIFGNLQTTVAEEYRTLAVNVHIHRPNRDPLLPCLPNKKPILGVGAANGRWRYVNVVV